MPVDINLVESPRLLGVSSRPISIGAFLKFRFKDGLHDPFHCRLHNAIFYRCDGQCELHIHPMSLWVGICHPFHPLKGQRFPVLKTRRVSGIDTLILAHSERGSFSLNREWTDWG